MTNVGSAGPAAPAAGGAAAAPAEAAAGGEEKKKEEGMQSGTYYDYYVNAWVGTCTNSFYREGGVRRGHGLRSLRLSVSSRFPFLVSSSINVFSFRFVSCLHFLP